MPRSIDVSTEVFAKIWSHRVEGEEDENTILSRLLGLTSPIRAESDLEAEPGSSGTLVTRTLWRHDVRAGLLACHGEAPLREIYAAVRKIRVEKGRSVPLNLQAIVRRELEYNSSDSNAFTGKYDWFRSVGGLGSGVWALRNSGQEDG